MTDVSTAAVWQHVDDSLTVPVSVLVCNDYRVEVLVVDSFESELDVARKNSIEGK